MNNEAQRVLERAASLIDRPEKWIKYAHCIDASGVPTTICDKSACSFCLSGAIRRAAWERFGHGDTMTAMAILCERAVAEALEDDIQASDESDVLHTLTAEEDAPEMLFSANDRPETTHADVMHWLSKATEAAA